MYVDLQRELIGIDRDLASEYERKQMLEARRAEVIEGIKGVRKQYLNEMLRERIKW
jgi:hypothetical protein